jgi:hypothetical protein
VSSGSARDATSTRNDATGPACAQKRRVASSKPSTTTSLKKDDALLQRLFVPIGRRLAECLTEPHQHPDYDWQAPVAMDCTAEEMSKIVGLPKEYPSLYESTMWLLRDVRGRKGSLDSLKESYDSLHNSTSHIIQDKLVCADLERINGVPYQVAIEDCYDDTNPCDLVTIFYVGSDADRERAKAA